jgi:hypothetical protein
MGFMNGARAAGLWAAMAASAAVSNLPAVAADPDLPIAAAPARFVDPKADWFTTFCAAQCAASIFVGRLQTNSMAPMFGAEGFLPPSDYRFGPGAFIGGTFSRTIYDLAGYAALEGEVGVGKRFGRFNEGEAWVALYGRWKWFPWNNYLRTSVAISTGLNVATGVPDWEYRRTGSKGRAYLLHYLSPEVTFGLPDAKWDLFARLHHRSGGYDWWGPTELFKDASGGMQFLSVGMRYYF